MVWKPGQSGNPKGRPRKGDALSEMIRAEVEPRELVTIAVDLARNSHSETTRMAALNWLADRGYKRPAQLVEVTRGDTEFDNYDDAQLDAEEARLLAEVEAAQEQGEIVGLTPQGAAAIARLGGRGT